MTAVAFKARQTYEKYTYAGQAGNPDRGVINVAGASNSLEGSVTEAALRKYPSAGVLSAGFHNR
jgi:hypothetical protein